MSSEFLHFFGCKDLSSSKKHWPPRLKWWLKPTPPDFQIFQVTVLEVNTGVFPVKSEAEKRDPF